MSLPLATNHAYWVAIVIHPGSEEKFKYLLKLEISAFRVYESNIHKKLEEYVEGAWKQCVIIMTYWCLQIFVWVNNDLFGRSRIINALLFW